MKWLPFIAITAFCVSVVWIMVDGLIRERRQRKAIGNREAKMRAEIVGHTHVRCNVSEP